ncbi:hypothetical protein BaRGS_00026072 [Batillaria attramentaria]|uniref:Secreted protein n=1 Tax=Batillaria attramentaria TaxID=370345 RepID=A0ABD0K711_9CAEN
MTFLYCVLSVFPSSARLITGTCLTAQLSEKGKEVHSKFDTLQYYCDLKTVCEKSDGIKHQQQLLGLSAMAGDGQACCVATDHLSRHLPRQQQQEKPHVHHRLTPSSGSWNISCSQRPFKRQVA